MLKGFIDAMGYLFCSIIMAALVGFVLINLMVGCNDWSDPACVTPSQFLEFFIPG